MDPNLASYTSVTPELEKAERRAFLEHLADGSEAEQAVAIDWLTDFQSTRGVMHLVMAGLIRVAVKHGQLRFQVVGDVDDFVMDRIERAGLFANDDEKEDGDSTIN